MEEFAARESGNETAMRINKDGFLQTAHVHNFRCISFPLTYEACVFAASNSPFRLFGAINKLPQLGTNCLLSSGYHGWDPR